MNESGISNIVGDICILPSDAELYEDPRINHLRKIIYGFMMPLILAVGIIGNILNLIVLTRRNMQGVAYIYMRGYSAASLLAIIFCIPFSLRVLIYKESGAWTNWFQAFYHVHLELYLGNGCIGVGVMMLLALTIERHASVCRRRLQFAGQPACGPPGLMVLLLPLTTLLLYAPDFFRHEIRSCRLGSALYHQKRENLGLLRSPVYQTYKVLLELAFKIGPTILLAVLNLRIVLVYRRTCNKRRRLRVRRSDRENRSFAEERRLTLLLGSTSLLFFVCVSPMVFLNVTLSERNLSIFSYQVFRAVANLLEVTNHSLSFYVYCLFSDDFRSTLVRTLGCRFRVRSGVPSPLPSPTPTSNQSSRTPQARAEATTAPAPAPRTD